VLPELQSMYILISYLKCDEFGWSVLYKEALSLHFSTNQPTRFIDHGCHSKLKMPKASKARGGKRREWKSDATSESNKSQASRKLTQLAPRKLLSVETIIYDSLNLLQYTHT
jgi:hypothetical protein